MEICAEGSAMSAARREAMSGEGEPEPAAGGEPASAGGCGCKIESSPGKKRPLCALTGFLCANLLFWFLALTPWRLYHLVSLVLLGIVLIQLMKDMVLSRVKGAKLWRSFTESWEVVDPKSEYRLRLNQCVEEKLMSFFLFLHEMAHFKEQNPGKFCLLVCSVCTFFTVLGSYIPGVVLSYLLLLGAFLCSLFTCSEFGQKLLSNMKSVLLKLDLGIRDCINQKLKERAEMIKTKLIEDDGELDISSLCPKVSPTVVAREMSVSDTDVSEISWTENGTFNLSEGNTPQTDTSDDFDRPSDHEEVFAKELSEFPSVENGAGTNDEDDSSFGMPVQQGGKKDRHPSLSSQRTRKEKEGLSAAGLSLPLLNNQAFNLVQAMATDVVTSAVTAAVRDQLQSMQADPNFSEETDSEDGDDFELLDQSELEQIESELGLTKGEEAESQEKKFSGFLSNLLGSH